MKTKRLNADTEIPVLGLGTWQLQGDEGRKAVINALNTGYRHIDTAEAYNNQEMIGAAINQAGVKREDLFIASKVWRSNLRRDDVIDACEKMLEKLQVDYLDLYLIHWPNSDVPIKETLEAMNELKEVGVIKAIGVSNFTTQHLRDALATGVEITTNQVEFHPSLNQDGLRRYCGNYNIVVTAYSPLAQGEDFELPVIKELAEKYDHSKAQIILNWIISKGMVAIPRSSSSGHIRENFDVLDWQLEARDVEKINKLDADNRLIEPDFAEF